MADSIADRFITAMARIRELDTVRNDDPMRYAMYNAKQAAEKVLDDAIRTAWIIADNARQMHKDAVEARNEAVKAATLTAHQPKDHDND